MSRANRLSQAIFRSSVVWGGLASLGFYAFIHSLTRSGTWQGEFAQRYFANHWTLYVETIVFFIGLAELLLRLFDVTSQASRVGQPLLGERPSAPQNASDVEGLLTRLDDLPAAEREGYMPRRLREALQSVLRQGAADKLDDELKYLADVDAARSHSGYALTRIIIWAIPILGFLGTVIGITQAIASIDPKALEASMGGVTGGLGVAFDTTALALVLSMILMFIQFGVDGRESKLLERVDSQAARELCGRFEQAGGNDPHVAVVRRMAEAVVKSCERLAQRQAEVWQDTIESAHGRWNDLTSSASEHVERALRGAIEGGVRAHAERLAESTLDHDERQREHWSKFQHALGETAMVARAQQAELTRQTDVLLQVVDATGQVVRLENALNGNLAALAGAQHLQETMLNLAAALHLLNARLGQSAGVSRHVELTDAAGLGKAA